MIEGIVEGVEQIVRKDGVSDKGKPWIMWTSNLKVNGKSYGINSFNSQKELEDKLVKVALRDKVRFNIEARGKFVNIVGEIEVISHGNAGNEVIDLDAPEPVKAGPDWDAKDRRIVRQNCLSHADEYAKLIFAFDGTVIDSKKYFAVAEACEKWVYRGME